MVNRLVLNLSEELHHRENSLATTDLYTITSNTVRSFLGNIGASIQLGDNPVDAAQESDEQECFEDTATLGRLVQDSESIYSVI